MNRLEFPPDPDMLDEEDSRDFAAGLREMIFEGLWWAFSILVIVASLALIFAGEFLIGGAP